MHAVLSVIALLFVLFVAADSLRWAAQDRARQFADDELAALGREIEIEAGALRHWAPQGPAERKHAAVPETAVDDAAAASAELADRDWRNRR